MPWGWPEVAQENTVLEPGCNPESQQVPAQSSKDHPWHCGQERKKKGWPTIWEVQATLLVPPQLPSPAQRRRAQEQ